MADSSTPRVVFIYTLTDPRTGEVRYVGKSTDPRDRLIRHLREARKLSTCYRHHWLRQLQEEGLRPVLAIIDQATDDTWIEAERRWIAHYRYLGYRLVNGTDGGDGAYGRKVSPELQAKLKAASSRAQLGKPKSPEHRERIRQGLKGQVIPPEVRAKMSAAAKVKVFTPEHRAKMSAARKGRKRPPEVCAKIGAGHAKSFILISPDGEEIAVFNLSAFCRERGLTAANFYGVLKGTHPSHKGWRIRRPEE